MIIMEDIYETIINLTVALTNNILNVNPDIDIAELNIQFYKMAPESPHHVLKTTIDAIINKTFYERKYIKPKFNDTKIQENVNAFISEITKIFTSNNNGLIYEITYGIIELVVLIITKWPELSKIQVKEKLIKLNIPNFNNDIYVNALFSLIYDEIMSVQIQ